MGENEVYSLTIHNPVYQMLSVQVALR